MFGNCCSTPGNLSVGRTCGLVNSDSFEMQEIPLFPHSDQALISEHSARIFDDSMDVDHLPFSELTGDSSLIFESSRRHMSESLQVSAGLVRYHSAPSSMLGGLVDDYFLNDLDPLGQVAGGGFTQLLADDLTSIGRSNTGCDTTVLQKADSMQKGKVLHEVHGQEPKQPCSEQGDTKKVVHLQPRFRKTSRKGLGQDDTSLSAILEYSQEGYSDSFCSSQTSASCTQEGMGTGHLLGASIAPVTTSESRSNLVRHSSLPAGLLSYLAMEARSQLESSEGPNCLSRPHRIPNKSSCNSTGRGIPAFAVTNNLNAGVPNKKIDPDLGRLEKYPSSSKRGLSRQSSLPAGLFSQLSLQAILGDGNELALPLTSETRMQGVHNSAMLAARKQIIEPDAKKLPGSKFSDCLAPEAGAPVPDQLTLPTNSPDSQLMIDKALSDAVLCRARAKRGCATHPRSIAERVRRSKISERMKKLQELVPNMDKQANTAEMLDEAVEYIKFLQRQVQELSENQAKCDGSCMHKKTT